MQQQRLPARPREDAGAHTAFRGRPPGPIRNGFVERFEPLQKAIANAANGDMVPNRGGFLGGQVPCQESG
jgi:hypothetical protein